MGWGGAAVAQASLRAPPADGAFSTHPGAERARQALPAAVVEADLVAGEAAAAVERGAACGGGWKRGRGGGV